MTREEEIKNEAISRFKIEHPFIDIARETFIEGIEWADENPKPNTIKKIFKFALEKTNFLIADNLESIDWGVLIKKAMEK